MAICWRIQTTSGLALDHQTCRVKLSLLELTQTLYSCRPVGFLNMPVSTELDTVAALGASMLSMSCNNSVSGTTTVNLSRSSSSVAAVWLLGDLYSVLGIAHTVLTPLGARARECHTQVRCSGRQCRPPNTGEQIIVLTRVMSQKLCKVILQGSCSVDCFSTQRLTRIAEVPPQPGGTPVIF